MVGVMQTIQQQHRVSPITVEAACAQWLNETKRMMRSVVQDLCYTATRAFASQICESNKAHLRITNAERMILRSSDWDAPYWVKPAIVSPLKFHGHQRVFCDYAVSVGGLGHRNKDLQNLVMLECSEQRWRTRWVAQPNSSYLLHCNFTEGCGTFRLKSCESSIAIDVNVPKRATYPSVDFALMNNREEVKYMFLSQ